MIVFDNITKQFTIRDQGVGDNKHTMRLEIDHKIMLRMSSLRKIMKVPINLRK